MRKALVVGINDYPSPITRLRGCVNDAAAIADVLRTNGDGSPNFDVKLLTSPSAQVGKAVLWGAIEELFGGKNDISLLYFSGHGIVTYTGGYVATTDAKRYERGVSMDNIMLQAGKSQANDKIIILDCCHSGMLGNPEITRSGVAITDGFSILTANRSSETAMDVNGKSVFSSLIVSALQGCAADLQGKISMGGIYGYVDQALGTWDQRPIFRTNVSHFTQLRSLPPPIPPELLRKICVYFPAPQDALKLDDNAAEPAKVETRQDLRKFASVGLVASAASANACRLTALGEHYWRLIKEKKI
jgi:hypothetical protein